MNIKRNDLCSCDSGKKFKHCCIGLYNKRQRWNNLEETLRSIVEECFKKYDNHRFIANALETFSTEVDFEDTSERRLFFDWLIHDYELKDDDYINKKFNITIIQKSLENLKNEYDNVDGYEKEKEFLEMWSHSAFRFYEVVDIKKGSGYNVIDVFDNPDKPLFLFDHLSSFTINKHDIVYARLYNVGEILRPAGGILTAPRSFLPFIKDYIIHSSQKYYNPKYKKSKMDKEEKNESVYIKKEKPLLHEYFRKESASIIKYLDFLNSDVNTKPTFTTAHGDPVTWSRSSFMIIKSIRRFLSILDASEEFVGLENEGSRTLRYDWVEKLDAKDNMLVSSARKPSPIVDDLNNDIVTDVHDKKQSKSSSSSTTRVGLHASSEELSLQTILWVPADEDEDDENYNKKIKKNIDGFIPYRVLGNLDITGNALVIECMSDVLLSKCNNLLQSLAGKYLRHMGNTYKEMSSRTSRDLDEQYSNMVSKEYEGNDQHNEVDGVDEVDDEDEYVNEDIQNTIENSFKRMIQQHYDNWITIKNPFLKNKTPLQAAKTKEGKQTLNELLKEMENNRYRNKNNSVEDLPPFPFEKIKKKLGL